MENFLSLKGCFPPISTPFDQRGKVAFERLAENLEWWQKNTPLAGFAVLGSNGESPYLNEAEKIDTFKAARAAIRKDRLFIAGTGCESTLATIELTEKAGNIGADAALVVTPHYFKGKMDHQALVNHYVSLADRSPIPIILYNVPNFTGIDMSPETIIECAQHPNVLGCKESSGNVVKMALVASATPERFQVLAGSGSFLLPAMLMGAVGGIMAVAALAAAQLDEMIRSFEKGDLQRAKEIQVKLIPPNNAVTSLFGVAGLKYAMDLVGLYGGPVRSPLRELTSQQKNLLKDILVKSGTL